jgi:hypothetical protein
VTARPDVDAMPWTSLIGADREPRASWGAPPIPIL